MAECAALPSLSADASAADAEIHVHEIIAAYAECAVGKRMLIEAIRRDCQAVDPKAESVP